MKFNPTIFERLLFPLHKRAYRQIQDALDAIDKKHPGQLQRVLADFKESAHSDTQTATWRPGKAGDFVYPTLDIAIFFDKSADYKLSTLHKSTDYKIAVSYDEKPPPNTQAVTSSLAFTGAMCLTLSLSRWNTFWASTSKQFCVKAPTSFTPIPSFRRIIASSSASAWSRPEYPPLATACVASKITRRTR